jgi:hypothetical protein
VPKQPRPKENLSTKITLNVVFITFGEPQAHGDTAFAVPQLENYH